eukprot:346805-Alexandrium_andersonii.AAC.1
MAAVPGTSLGLLSGALLRMSQRAEQHPSGPSIVQRRRRADSGVGKRGAVRGPTSGLSLEEHPH